MVEKTPQCHLPARFLPRSWQREAESEGRRSAQGPCDGGRGRRCRPQRAEAQSGERHDPDDLIAGQEAQMSRAPPTVRSDAAGELAGIQKVKADEGIAGRRGQPIPVGSPNVSD